MTTNISQEMDILVRRLNELNNAYYNTSTPLVTDSVYDALYLKLKDLESEYPTLIRPDSPTQNVGYKSCGRRLEVIHPVTMYSLRNCYTEKEVETFLKSIPPTVNGFELVLEPKLDGVALDIIYFDGELVQAITRGDGVSGEDVTAHARVIEGVPLTIKGLGETVVHGEVTMSKANLAKLNENLPEGSKFSNTRNAAAGTLMQSSTVVVAQRGVQFTAFNHANGEHSTYVDSIKWLLEQGFTTPTGHVVPASMDKITEVYNQLLEKRPSLEGEIDGVVIKVNETNIQRSMGHNSKAPKWARAYKFPASEFTTTLTDVIWQVSRIGTLNPVGVVSKVTIGGVDITRVNLHNHVTVRRLDLHIGDVVTVKRAGDVIPAMGTVYRDLRPTGATLVTLPSHCPSCGSKIQHIGTEGRCGAGMDCPDQLVEYVRHFTKRKALDLNGFGPRVVEGLVHSGLVKRLSDLYVVTYDRLIALDGIGPGKAKSLMDEIENSKGVGMGTLLFAMSVPNVGSKVASVLTKKYPTWSSLLSVDLDSLANISGVTTKAAEAIVSLRDNKTFLQELERFMEYGVIPKENIQITHVPMGV